MFADSNEKLKASVETLNKSYSELKSAQCWLPGLEVTKLIGRNPDGGEWRGAMLNIG